LGSLRQHDLHLCSLYTTADLRTYAGLYFPAGTSAAQLDALQQQLEEVNGRLLRGCASDLVALMLPDILLPPHKGGMAQVTQPLYTIVESVHAVACVNLLQRVASLWIIDACGSCLAETAAAMQR
jgi:hypothetical protein